MIEDFQKSKFEDLFDDEDEDKTLMKVNDLRRFVVNSDGKICLAILKATSFRFHAGKEMIFRTTAKYANLASQATKINVIRQLIEIRQSDSQPSLWEWPKQYVNLDVNTNSELLTRNLFSLEIPSTLLHPLTQRIMRHKEMVPEEKLQWTVMTEELEHVLEYTWECLDPEGDKIMSNLALLTTIKNPIAIPYQNKTGKHLEIYHKHINDLTIPDESCFFIRNIPSNLLPKPKLNGKERVCCFICCVAKPLHQMHNHVGQHILFAMRGIEETGLINLVSH